MFEGGKCITSRKTGNSKEARTHNEILDFFKRSQLYTSLQLRGFRTFYSALAILLKTKLIHKLLENEQISKTNGKNATQVI